MQKILSVTHIYAGFLSLILFWFPLILRKGSIWHKRTGIAFCISIILVIISAICFSIEHLIKKEYPIGLGFSFLSLLTTKVLTEGFTAARFKNILPGVKIVIRFIDICMALLSIIIIVTGYFINSNFLLILGTIGLFLFIRWKMRNKMLGNKLDWKQLHYSGMIHCGVSAYTAFLVIGFNSFFGGTSFEIGGLSIVRWILPAVLGILGIRHLDNIYKKKILANKLINESAKKEQQN